jgi:hypothetical protein
MKKIFGNNQLSDLGMKIANQILINPGGCNFAAPLQDASSILEQRFLPLMDHRRVNAVGGRHLRNRPLTLQGLDRNTRLEC